MNGSIVAVSVVVRTMSHITIAPSWCGIIPRTKSTCGSPVNSIAIPSCIAMFSCMYMLVDAQSISPQPIIMPICSSESMSALFMTVPSGITCMPGGAGATISCASEAATTHATANPLYIVFTMAETAWRCSAR